jgi:hypothetical protein
MDVTIAVTSRPTSARCKPAASGTDQIRHRQQARPVRTFHTASRARGARRARLAGRAERNARKPFTMGCSASARSWLASSGQPYGAGRRLPSFGPGGPRRRRRGLTPAADRMGYSPQRQPWRASVAEAGHPSVAWIVKPCVLAVKSARCARVAARSLRASGPLCRRDSGTPIGGMARTEVCAMTNALRQETYCSTATPVIRGILICG